MSETAYQLRRDVKHLIDHDHDAWLLHKFDGWQNISFDMLKSYENVLPDELEFGATFDTLAWNDYPTNNVYWPIMSTKMVDTLHSVGSFAHRTIPIIMLDKRLGGFVDGKPVPRDTENHDYVVLQLLEHSDFFDWENSTYEIDPDYPDYPENVSSLKLKTRPQGFPPLFRLSISPTYLFVSESAKLALEAANIGGVKFVPLVDVRL